MVIPAATTAATSARFIVHPFVWRSSPPASAYQIAGVEVIQTASDITNRSHAHEVSLRKALSGDEGQRIRRLCQSGGDATTAAEVDDEPVADDDAGRERPGPTRSRD
jgi:hypothetical protein